jgi:hypothetical protein
MYRNLSLAALAIASLALYAGSAHAQLRMRVVEEAIESSTEIVGLPESLPSSLGFKPCGTCAYVTLSVDSTTRFFVGRHRVSLADLRHQASRGPRRLDVFYDRRSKVATRLILRTALDGSAPE